MKRNIIMIDHADKSWIREGEKFTEEELKKIDEIEYDFMKNLLKVMALAWVLMAFAHLLKL